MKRFFILTLLFCTLISLTACTGVQRDLLEEMSAPSDWQATEFKQKATISISAMDEKEELSINSEGYMNMGDMQAHITTTLDTTDDLLDLPTMEIYLDDYTLYFNKEFIANSFTSANIPAPKMLRELNADYIGVELFDEETAKLFTELYTPEFNQQMQDLYRDLGTEFGVDLPVQKNGDTYTIKLNGVEIAELYNHLMTKENVNRSIDIINEHLDADLSLDYYTLEPIPLDEETIAFLTPLTLEIRYTFEDDQFTQEISIDYQFIEDININLHFISETTKATARELTLPDRNVTLTMEEYEELFVINGAVISITDGLLMPLDGFTTPIEITTLNKNGEIFLPIRPIMDALDYEVGYDAESAAVTIGKDEPSIPVAVIVEDSTSYISVKELMKQLFVVQTLDEDTVLVME